MRREILYFRGSVLVCPFSPLTDIILIAIAGASQRHLQNIRLVAQSQPALIKEIGFYSRGRIVAAGLPHRSYVGVASGLLKDSQCAASHWPRRDEAGGNTCKVQEVGQGPRWVLGNVEIADILLSKFCVSQLPRRSFLR